jgi:hypothetical protein
MITPPTRFIKIGDFAEIAGKTHVCKKRDVMHHTCKDCSLNEENCDNIQCSKDDREDKTSVIFNLVLE